MATLDIKNVLNPLVLAVEEVASSIVDLPEVDATEINKYLENIKDLNGDIKEMFTTILKSMLRVRKEAISQRAIAKQSQQNVTNLNATIIELKNDLGRELSMSLSEKVRRLEEENKSGYRPHIYVDGGINSKNSTQLNNEPSIRTAPNLYTSRTQPGIQSTSINSQSNTCAEVFGDQHNANNDNHISQARSYNISEDSKGQAINATSNPNPGPQYNAYGKTLGSVTSETVEPRAFIYPVPEDRGNTSTYINSKMQSKDA
jgi:hypothetical protein